MANDPRPYSTAPTLAEIENLHLRSQNRHTQDIMMKHINVLYPVLAQARNKAKESIHAQRQRYFDVRQKAPKFSEIMVVEDEGKRLTFQVSLSGSYETILREVLQQDQGKVMAYIDGRDIVITRAQLPSVILDSLEGKRLDEVVELPKHYINVLDSNAPIIEKVFVRMNQVVLRTTLALAGDYITH